MIVSKETQEKIDSLFKNNAMIREKLYECDATAIREIGSLSQRGINPDDVIAAYESGEQEVMDYLYRQAKRMVELKELYKELCFEYYKKMKATQGVETSDIKPRSI